MLSHRPVIVPFYEKDFHKERIFLLGVENLILSFEGKKSSIGFWLLAIRSDLARFGGIFRIWLDLVGFSRIWLDLVGF